MTDVKPDAAIFVDPSSHHFLGDRLFDTSNAFLNRDGTLLPFARLKAHFNARGVPVHTADRLREGDVVAKVNHYWSLGILDGWRELAVRDDVRLRGFLIMEPPLVAPGQYRALPEVTRYFETAWVHNCEGDGIDLKGVDAAKLRKLRWPQPYPAEVEPWWGRADRLNKLVVIAGNHNPRWRRPEYYSRRIEAVAALVDQDAIDLFGRGWDKWWSRHSAWLPYWRHRRALMRAYRGGCESKLEVLSRYRFSLCLENMPMKGYLTEKLFDCLYAGTVPVYLGAPDIAQLVPPGAYVDLRQYPSVQAMHDAIRHMSDGEWQRMREVGREFLRTSGRSDYHDSLVHIFDDDAG